MRWFRSRTPCLVIFVVGSVLSLLCVPMSHLLCRVRHVLTMRNINRHSSEISWYPLDRSRRGVRPVAMKDPSRAFPRAGQGIVAGMEWLNYHHLLYFWTVARHGSVVRASRELNLAQPTISGQVRRLEEVIGEKLFERVGRGLVLTSVGRTVFRHADEIFAIGRDLMGTLKGRGSTRPLRFTVGVADALPMALVY